MKQTTLPQAVFRAFGCEGTPEKLPGGEGKAFLVEDVVFKPIENIARYEWASELLLRVPQAGFRISVPRKSFQGRFTYAGWGATTYEPGEHVEGNWGEKLRVCRAFHNALQGLSARPMPPSQDRWTLAHGIAWQDAALPPAVHPAMRGRINAIFDKYQSLEPSNQIIHGDMCGNVLFAADLPPLIIDFSPDERPQAYAEAILIADAIAWENAPVALKSALPETPHSQQMLIRAVNFRVIVTALFSPQDVPNFEQAYACFAPLLERLV